MIIYNNKLLYYKNAADLNLYESIMNNLLKKYKVLCIIQIK